MDIHIWDLLGMKRADIAVNIKDNLKDEIANKITGDIYAIAKGLKLSPARLYEYFIWKKSEVPLSIVFELSRIFRIPNKIIEDNIISYKQLHVPSKNAVKNPNLPIKVSPYFTSIVANLFFDGSVPEDGKGTYYNQKNKEIMGDFINKVIYVFGDVNYSLVTDHRGVLKCRIPRIIGEICRQVYNVKSFGTFNSRVPKRVFKLDEEHKIAFVLTGIIDEGSIAYDGSVIFGVSNRNMIYDFKRLCEHIGLKTGKVKYRNKSGHYYIYIKSIKKLHQIVKSFNEKYPLINLRHKRQRLIKSLQIRNQKSYHTHDFAEKRKLLVLEELRKSRCSINYLADKLLICPRTLRRYMGTFIKIRKVSRIKCKNEFIYYSLG